MGAMFSRHAVYANAHGTVRNAWRVIWLQKPGEEWERAASCRDSL